jgi:hypothetical protein
MRTRVAPATIAAPLWHTHSIDETVRQTNTSLEHRCRYGRHWD